MCKSLPTDKVQLRVIRIMYYPVIDGYCVYSSLCVLPPAKRKKLTMVFGVTIPCILSIFSVILFLRLGFVLGQVVTTIPPLLSCAVLGVLL